MYKKMDNLYKMYDRYDEHKTEITFLSHPNSCSSFTSFLHNYNYFIIQHQPTTNDYKKILDHFENIIKYRVELYRTNTICPKTQYYLEEIKLPKVEKPKESVQVQQQPKHAENHVPPATSPPSEVELEAPRDELRTPRVELQAPRDELRTPRDELRTPRVELRTPLEGDQSYQETLATRAQHAEQQQEQGFHYGAIPKREFPIDSSTVYPTRNRPLESSETSPYSEQYPHLPVLPSPNEVGDTSSSVMSTITSALRDVEPGPVLGVSGGMGVLFLLFKYTPVGSFFGGRRGRFRQIPRSFGGFPPGEFPNFQDYEGGYIGYGPTSISSLAE
ncbi:hypothetical protein PVBG_05672 [Plasmodium vivax Brazil I]|uniref:VIR protein n=1 Tax=Plasmodium vivax (strain Brazil I) TaxID=1033975 RepID=A0A0J9T123_PLAV1|nr:hypothetical protein PVBG_05672 [Plasmodium vivax Brazil I]